MSTALPTVDIQIKNNDMYLSGVLDFDTVTLILPKIDQFLAKISSAIVHLEGISYSNSAGVSLLLHIRRIAEKRQAVVSFNAIPKELAELILLCGLDDVLH